ncbi:PAQR family membrane homeostasis protein TrhA [Streptomyces mutabilis]|uniref:PAQR family membrane homeostasis protein TrhA n=1 Tax=Streptomyces mutabilis TaxID=67332 RepID=UPI003A4C541E
MPGSARTASQPSASLTRSRPGRRPPGRRPARTAPGRRRAPRRPGRTAGAGLPRTPATWACAVYAVTAWLLFGTSAVYHLGIWGPLGEAVLRRLDHANIFLIIAGTCTPLAVLLPADRQALLLWIVWTGALAGIAFRVLWVSAPRWLYTPCYLALGWAPVRYLPDFLRTGGAAVVTLIVAGGLLYSAGAVVYAVQRPNPSPRWFGFHEVFHALTVAAFTAHYIAISLAVY